MKRVKISPGYHPGGNGRFTFLNVIEILSSPWGKAMAAERLSSPENPPRTMRITSPELENRLKQVRLGCIARNRSSI